VVSVVGPGGVWFVQLLRNQWSTWAISSHQRLAQLLGLLKVVPGCSATVQRRGEFEQCLRRRLASPSATECIELLVESDGAGEERYGSVEVALLALEAAQVEDRVPNEGGNQRRSGAISLGAAYLMKEALGEDKAGHQGR
jgi:hypothetical protein